MKASIPVLQKIKKAVDEEDLDSVRKYAGRYSGDYGLKKIFREYRINPKSKALKKNLDSLIKVREIEADGGQQLALKDRRRLREDE